MLGFCSAQPQSLQSEFRRQLIIQILVWTAIVLFLGAAIHAVFRWNVLFPIRKLIAASQKVGRGQHTLVEVESSDELGLLARAFNAMTEEVKEEQAKLHRQANSTSDRLPKRRWLSLESIFQSAGQAFR